MSADFIAPSMPTVTGGKRLNYIGVVDKEVCEINFILQKSTARSENVKALF